MGSILESIIKQATQGGGGLGDIIESLNPGSGNSHTGDILNEINEKLGRESTTTSSTPTSSSDISISDLERELGIGTGSGGSRRTSTTTSVDDNNSGSLEDILNVGREENESGSVSLPGAESGGGLFSGKLMSILKVVGMAALASFIFKKFTK